MPAPTAAATPIGDDHSVLLWQTCAYAEDLGDAARSGRRLLPAYDELLGFLHHRLLPYLDDEERDAPPAGMRDRRLLEVLVADHQRLRGDVDNVEQSRTRRVLALATTTLVERLERHVRREQTWFADGASDAERRDVCDWAVPLLLGDVVDVDALPPGCRDDLVGRRLSWMRPGDEVRLESAHDLHPLWLRRQVVDQGALAWVYEEEGPSAWRVRVTRRAPDDC